MQDNNVTKRLYYNQPDLLEFDSVVEQAESEGERNLSDSRPSVVLRESAFYPTSGGQGHDTGWITIDRSTTASSAEKQRVRVSEVVAAEDGRVIHYLEAPLHLPSGQPAAFSIEQGTIVHGAIDRDRRRDHMQQHTGQHVLSAAFIEQYEMPTVSFHMAEDYCSIDLAVASVSAEQVAGAERRANEIVFENRPVTIRYVTRAEAEKLGLRKMPPAERDELRLIEIANFDLSACGGTHVAASGQIGSILLRKTEKVRQGVRVEFVCGGRAVGMARRDYTTLAESAGLFSAQMTDVPEMIRKAAEENRTLRKQKEEALEELAGLMAADAVAARDRAIESPGDLDSLAGKRSRKTLVITRAFADHDVAFVKLFAQKVTRAGVPVIALVGSSVDPAGMVFAQSAGVGADMGSLLKQTLTAVGGRGGGSKDFAQGGVPPGRDIQRILQEAAGRIEG
jgi:alanyl-tRNA synthetase